MKLHFLLTAGAALLCAAPIVAAEVSDCCFVCAQSLIGTCTCTPTLAIMSITTTFVTLLNLSTLPSGQRYSSRCRPSYTEPNSSSSSYSCTNPSSSSSAQRRDERDRERIVIVWRNTWTDDQCTGNRRSLSEVCSELNRLVCSLSS